MKEKVGDTAVVEELRDLISAEELVGHVLEDIVSDNPPDDVAAEFIEDFVQTDRPETDQVLALLGSPSDVLVGHLKGFLAQSYQANLTALDSRGVAFLDGLEAAIRARLAAELAEETTEAE